MSVLSGRYLNAHRSQYQSGATTRTRRQGCTWTSLANGVDATSKGTISRTPDQVLKLVMPSEETNPLTPGWSLDDARLAASRLRVPLLIRSGSGWGALVQASGAGYYLLVQGDSDRFSNDTCSGEFDGDHCIGVHPGVRTVDGEREHWIDDPICPTGRWERDSVIRAYAEKFSSSIRFAAFRDPVPLVQRTYRCVISGYTPMYTAPFGVRTGAVTRASYTVTRRNVDGLWWFKVIAPITSGNIGRSFKPNRYTEFTAL